MSHAERCPVCEGSGQVYDTWEPGGTAPPKRICHGCNGRGWVEVGYIPYYVPYQPVNPPSYEPLYSPFTWPSYITCDATNLNAYDGGYYTSDMTDGRT